MWGTNDPVGAGFIKSLAHPGGNVTGVAGMFADSIGKSVELLRAVLPTAKRMAVLTSSNPNHPRQYELAEAAGRALDSSLRDVKQDDSNNEVAPSRGGEQIDDVLDGLVGAVVGGFESAVWAMLRVRTVVEATVGKWSAQPFVEEQK